MSGVRELSKLPWRWNRTQLLPQSKQIRHGPMFHDQASRDAEDVHGAKCHQPAGWRKTHKIASVSAPGNKEPGDFIVFSDQGFNRGVKTREGRYMVKSCFTP
jgi:hypothetical protein